MYPKRLIQLLAEVFTINNSGQTSVRVTDEDAMLSQIIDESSATNTYLGYTAMGGVSSASTSTWRIKRINKVGLIQTIGFADGTNAFTKVWASRATYSYY